MPIKALVFDAYGTLFDTQSVASAVEAAFPRRGDLITQVWRLKQLEYSWLRTVMGVHADFAAITREALLYALDAAGLASPDATVTRLCAAFDALEPYPDTLQALEALAGHRLAVLSNGSPAMLAALLDHAGLAARFEAVISTEAARCFKPHPDVYRLTTDALRLPAEEILLVSSNGFDLAGAKRFGLKTARIERMPVERLRAALAEATALEPKVLFAALRSRQESFGGAPDIVCPSLGDLANRLGAWGSDGSGSRT